MTSQNTPMKQEAYADITALNEPHMPVLLLLDTSGSMKGAPLQELIQGYHDFITLSAQDANAMKRVDIAVLQFGHEIKLIQDFIPLSKAAETPDLTLTAEGRTPMGAAIEKAIQIVRERCRVYDDAGIPRFKPWIFMITDGESTDDLQNAKELLRQREEIGRLKFFSVGVNGANTEILKTLSPRVIEATKENQFKSIFNWLSESMSIISRSKVSDHTELPKMLPEDFRVVPSDW